ADEDRSRRGSELTMAAAPVVDLADVRRTVEANRDEIEAQRRLPDAVVGALQASGLHRLLVPAVLGGHAVPVEGAVRAVEAIAAADGSAGWCAAIGAGSNLFAGYLPEDGAREVFAEPDLGNATMFAPTGVVEADGRHGRLSGRWAFTSNCLHSAWA